MVTLPLLVLVALSLATALFGTLGGIGGAVILVPVLVLLGVDPRLASPLGIVSVAAGSLAAAPRHLDDGVVHHRLGVTLETTSSAGAIIGAMIGSAISRAFLTRVLAAIAIAAAIAGGRRKGLRNQPATVFALESAGEWPGSLSGAYRLSDTEIVPYSAQRVPVGLVGMLGAGLISGLAGVGGGFIKTPIMSEVMHVPVRVAAATSTFTVGITSAASLIVFSRQGRIDYQAAAAVLIGGIIGGLLGAQLGRRLHPQLIRRVLTAALLMVGGVLLVTG